MSSLHPLSLLISSMVFELARHTPTTPLQLAFFNQHSGTLLALMVLLRACTEQQSSLSLVLAKGICE